MIKPVEKPTLSKVEWDKRVIKLAAFYLNIIECEDCGGPKNKGDVCLSCQEKPNE